MKSTRIKLRKVNQSDIESIHRGLSHPDVIKYYGVSYMTLEATQEQMDWYANLERTGTGQWFAVEDISTGTFLGAGGFNDVDNTHHKAEIGFWLLPEYWGKGYMKEAMPLLLQYGAGDLALHRIEGFVDPENANCKKAIVKCGFDYEGTMRDCEVKDGAYISTDIYAKIMD